MQKIVLLNTLPAVFAGREEDRSEVWLRNVEFERGKHYLISAESGTGKSSLCSYIYGYRIDYSGVMQFDGTDIRTLSVEQWCDVRKNHSTQKSVDQFQDRERDYILLRASGHT